MIKTLILTWKAIERASADSHMTDTLVWDLALAVILSGLFTYFQFICMMCEQGLDMYYTFTI